MIRTRLFLPTILVLCLSIALSAQSYNTTVGMRLGTDWGISAQHRVDKRFTIEGIIQSSLFREEVTITALGEQHYPFLSKRFNFYMGGGLHKGWLTNSDEVSYKDPFGIDFIAGIEFTMARINLSWDFKPAVNLIGGERTIYSQSGLSLRYVIAKKPLFEGKNKKNRRKKDKKFNWKFWEKD